LRPTEAMECYSLEAKPTRVTLAETFSTGEDGDYGYDDDNYHHDDHPNQPYRQQPQLQQQQQQRHLEQDEQDLMGFQHTFSSDDEYQHGVPNLGASFINLVDNDADVNHYASRSYDEDNYDNGRDDYLSNRLGTDSTCSSGEDFINLAQEAANIQSRHFRTTTSLREDEFECYAQLYGLEEEEEEEQEENGQNIHQEDTTVLQFVDSEDGQAFSFHTRANHARHATTVTYENNSSRHYRTMGQDFLQQNVSLEATSMGYETCSKTLNTNLETLHTDLEGVNYIPTHHDQEIVHDPAYYNSIHHGTIELHSPTSDDAEGESYDDDEERIGGAVGVHIAPNASYRYEEDGYVRHGHNGKEDGFRHDNSFQDTETTYHDDNFAEFTRDTNADDVHDTEALSQLMDSYLSDRSSVTSWDEGSYASASRAVSRLDSFDGTEYTEDTGRGNGTLMDILKNFRDMNVSDRRGMSYSDDEDGEAEIVSDVEERGDKTTKGIAKRRRSKRRSTKRDLTSVLGQIGAVGMNLLNETMEQGKQGSRRSPRHHRRRRSDQAGKIIDSLRDIFSCGAPSHY
jgi:hypothetical protein